MIGDTPLVTIAELTKQHCLRVLEQCEWDNAKAAAMLGISGARLYRWRATWPENRKKVRADKGRTNKPRGPNTVRQKMLAERADDIVTRFRAGAMLNEIGALYGISRERVRQVLKKRGLDGMDGGRHMRTVAQNAQRVAARDAQCREKHGMSYEDYQVAKRIVAASGATAAQVYREQKRNALRVPYEWRLKFADWWAVWMASGHWDRRGTGAGMYWLVRKGNAGAYEPGNVEVVESGAFVAAMRARERAALGMAV